MRGQSTQTHAKFVVADRLWFQDGAVRPQEVGHRIVSIVGGVRERGRSCALW